MHVPDERYYINVSTMVCSAHQMRVGSMTYYVYVVRCEDGSYYTGSTKDVERRFEQHRKGHGARYTRIHEPEEIVYVEEFASRGAAIRREREIKSLSHNEKKRLAVQNES